MHLFNYGDFTLHSGAKSSFKIDCDALTDEDIEAIAKMLMEILPPFGNVEGIPTGGLRLAEALKPYCTPGAKSTRGSYRDSEWLIVDDVATTGKSIWDAMQKKEEEIGSRVNGAVIFDRSGGHEVNPYYSLFHTDGI